ncbi:MAG: hypothetical protein C0608_05330 [Deltaproteobacteria bacterium]|nr:MAG: hypothetical protein C0608_05330 [Deltaproteobacteria bacterium]
MSQKDHYNQSDSSTLKRGCQASDDVTDLCPCGSGKPFAKCHGKPCECGSGKPSYKCCQASDF